MRVLITGGYGFIGSHVAERFYKEGHDIFIIDNLSTGLQENINFRHKSYIEDVRSNRCHEIFKANRFDIIIHLAAQTDVTSSLEDPVSDSEANIVGLCNMLDLSKKHGVKQFIFASSAAVYGMNHEIPLKEDAKCNPVSPYGMNKFIGEYYCDKWDKLYALNSLCFRLSNVYGPRQGRNGEGGVISKFILKMINGENLTIFGDGNQTRDFIYVGDVVEAIYRGVMSNVTGIYNLSTNTETSVNNLVQTLSSFDKIPDVIYKEASQGDISRSRLDNEKVKRELDWVPKYSIESGLSKTYKWFKENEFRTNNKNKEIEKGIEDLHTKSNLKLFMPFFENIILFLLIIFIDVTLFRNIGNIDLKFLYIMLISLFFGKTQGVIAAMLSIGWYIFDSLNNGRDFISLFIDNAVISHFGGYILIALVIGYVIDRKNNKAQVAEAELISMQKKYQFLNHIYQETRAVKEELHDQIIHSEDSIGKIYNIIKNLDSLEPDDIFNGAISVLEQTMKTDAASIYIVSENQSFMRLISKSNKSNFQLQTSKQIKQSEEFVSLVNSQTFFINRSLKPELPMMMAPIIKDGKTIAIVNIHHVDFENLTLYYENLFRVVINLISASLTRAYDYVTATHHERYIEDSLILKPQYFKRMMDSKVYGKEKLNIPFTLLEAIISFENKNKLESLASSLRNTDHIGMDDVGRLWIILTNTTNEDSGIVIQRMTAKDIKVKLAKEEDLHVL